MIACCGAAQNTCCLFFHVSERKVESYSSTHCRHWAAGGNVCFQRPRGLSPTSGHLPLVYQPTGRTACVPIAPLRELELPCGASRARRRGVWRHPGVHPHGESHSAKSSAWYSARVKATVSGYPSIPTTVTAPDERPCMQTNVNVTSRSETTAS